MDRMYDLMEVVTHMENAARKAADAGEEGICEQIAEVLTATLNLLDEMYSKRGTP